MNILETERLVFRRYESRDENDFIALFTDPAVMKYVGDGVLNAEQAAAFWRKLFDELYPKGFNIWAIFTKADSRYVGHAGIYPRPTKKEDQEIVYFLVQTEWGKGYATEVARRLIELGFEYLNLLAVFATVNDDHFVSIRVLVKAGMKFERHEYDEDGRYSVYAARNS